MPRPTDVSAFGEAVYAQLAPVADQDINYDYPLLIFIATLGEMFKNLDEAAHSTPAWSLLLDVDETPVEALPWLGQLIGTVVNPNLPEVDQRNQIRNHLGWARGRPETIRNAIRPFLTGTKTVIILERDTSPYHFTVKTYSDESPPDVTYANLYNDYLTYQAFYDAYLTYQAYWLLDQREQIDAVIALVKPAGLQYDYTVLTGHP